MSVVHTQFTDIRRCTTYSYSYGILVYTLEHTQKVTQQQHIGDDDDDDDKVSDSNEAMKK